MTKRSEDVTGTIVIGTRNVPYGRRNIYRHTVVSLHGNFMRVSSISGGDSVVPHQREPLNVTDDVLGLRVRLGKKSITLPSVVTRESVSYSP